MKTLIVVYTYMHGVNASVMTLANAKHEMHIAVCLQGISWSMTMRYIIESLIEFIQEAREAHLEIANQ